jgi:hypothetical protein
MNWIVRGLEIALWVQFITFALHDTMPLGRLNNLGHFKQEIPLARRLKGSLMNIVTAGAIVVLFYAGWVHGGDMADVWRMTLLITLGVLVYMEFVAWWRPYLFGATPAIVEKLRPNWEGTYAFLPAKNGIRPNTMHCVMHASTLAGFVFALVDHFERSRMLH